MPKPENMTTSALGLKAGRIREGFSEDAYLCGGKKWTFGHGSTYRYIDGERVDVAPGDTITEAEAAELFALQWAEHESGIARAITRDISQPQFDVLADMAFQFGENFLLSGEGGTTGLREAINAGAWERVDGEIARWYWAGGRRDPGVYTRALARVCQWHALPWFWLYEASTRDTIKRDAAGRVIETPFMALNPDGTVREMVTPETALARARAVDALARAKAPAQEGVPTAPAPSKPTITIKAPPGVDIDDVLGEDTAPPAKPAPAPPAAPAPPLKRAKVRKPIISMGDPYAGAASAGLRASNIHYRGLDPALIKNAKPITESETFFGGVWIVIGQVLLNMGRRGFFIAVLPSWASVMLIDALQSPFILGVLATVTAAIFTAIVAAPRILKEGWRKMKHGRATATQLKY